MKGDHIYPEDSVPVYDALLHVDKPESADLDMVPIIGAYGARFWPQGTTDFTGSADEAVTRKYLHTLPHRGLIFLDIESWPTVGNELKTSIAQYREVVSWVRSERPGLTVGYYDILPRRDYWRAIRGPRTFGYRKWRQENKRLASIARAVDVIFPSLYTFYDLTTKWDNWLLYAEANLDEARRYKLPVIPFLWFQYHDSNVNLKGTKIPAEFWRRQLEFCRKHADGVIIWGGWKQSWDTEASWWQATKEFLDG